VQIIWVIVEPERLLGSDSPLGSYVACIASHAAAWRQRIEETRQARTLVMCKELCIMPPSPELEEKIIRSKQRFMAGETLPDEPTVDVLDMRTFTLITTRPKKTRAHTLVSPTQQYAPVTGTRRALVLLVDFSDKSATKTQGHYNDLLFSTGTYSTGSMRDYYREASYNKLDVTGIVSGTGGSTHIVTVFSDPKDLH
jgi:hypothetical protein